MLDAQAQAYLEELEALALPPIRERDLEEVRRAMDDGAGALFGEPDLVASVEDNDADGVPVRVYDPGADGAALVFFHGGGWVLGSLDSHDLLCRALAARSGCAVVSVDYRLAPEHPYPAAVEDAWTATRWAAERFPRIAVGGDSAGGHLAALMALEARDRSLALALQVLVYPITDYSFDTASYREHAEIANLPAATMRWFWEVFVPDEAARVEPVLSPLRADLDGVAPAFVLVAEYDTLCDEGEAYAEALRAAGVPVEFRRYDGMIHGFFRMPAVFDRSRGAIDEVAAAVRGALSPAD